MNTNNVVSLPGALDLGGKEHFVVKLTATGVDLATSADLALIIGTLMRAAPRQEDGVYVGKAVAVFRRYAGIHYAVIGASAAVVAPGDTLALDAANPGKLIKSGTTPCAIAVDAFTSVNGAIVRVIFT
jgi:hypothetical protein